MASISDAGGACSIGLEMVRKLKTENVSFLILGKPTIVDLQVRQRERKKECFNTKSYTLFAFFKAVDQNLFL